MVLPRAATSLTPSSSSMLRAAAVRSTVAQNARMAQRYQLQQRQASHAAELHSAQQQPQQHEERPEGFHGAFWRNTILGLVLAFATYRISIRHSPAMQAAAIDEEHDPEGTPVEAGKEEMPYLTRYIAHHLPREGLWRERNLKHLELTLQQAEDKLLVQDARRPKMKKFYHSVDLASPNGIPVGGTFVPESSNGKKKEEESSDDE